MKRKRVKKTTKKNEGQGKKEKKEKKKGEEKNEKKRKKMKRKNRKERKRENGKGKKTLRWDFNPGPTEYRALVRRGEQWSVLVSSWLVWTHGCFNSIESWAPAC